ncbi:MAG TPA: hypothetical protein VEL70_07855, partial [Candidatus Acidoferrum sp.]|nr:hypothetical protein [Candidatus Acidoferrum sp.]
MLNRGKNRTAYTLANYFHVERFVIQKQRGLCRYCKEGFDRTDIIASKGRISRNANGRNSPNAY